MSDEQDLLRDDRDLLRRFRAGTHEALAAVYRAYAGGVARLLRSGFSFASRGRTLRFCGYPQAFELENALQEIFIRAFDARTRLAYDGLRPYGAFLIGIARNVVIDEYRRNTMLFVEYDEQSASQAVPGLVRDEVQDAGEQHEQHELDALLAAFQRQLSAQQQAVYQARFHEQLSQDATAKKLSLTRIQLRRIEAKIKEELLAYCRQHGYLAERHDLGHSSLLHRAGKVTGG